MESEFTSQPSPARQQRFAGRTIVACSEQEQIALLLVVERAEPIGVHSIRGRAAWVGYTQQPVHQARDAQRQDCVHVVPQLELGQYAGRITLLTGTEPIGEVIEK